MAKVAAKSGEKTAAQSSDDAKDARIAREAQAALQKQAAGNSLTEKDERAIARFQLLQRTKHGEQYIAAFPKKQLSKYTGRQSKVLNEWQDRYGLPYDRYADSVDLRELLAYFANMLAEKGRLLFTDDSAEDDLLKMAPGPLKAELVRRIIEKNDISNESARIDLERKRGALVPIEPIADFHTAAASLIARLSENCGRRDMIAGYEVQQMISDLADDIARLAESTFGNGDETTNGKPIDAPG